MAHAWQIPAREYARQEERGGKRHAFNHLDPVTTALVIMDVVAFFNGNTHFAGVVESANQIAAGLRAAGGMVAWVLPSSDDPHPELSREFPGEDDLPRRKVLS